jgi:allophanate hydrolase subunit 1
MAQNGISTLSTKQARQAAKLAAAATRRAATSRRSTLNISQLPTVYSGNAISDNANSGGLVLGRPWT